jgi:sugar phosphate isomerase/epimerase
MMAAGAAATGVFDVRAAPLHWPIGCFNRPWMQVDAPVSPVGTSQPANWGLDVALTGMSQAGFKLTGLLTRTQGEPFIGSEATPEYLAGLKGKIAAAGLVAIVGALRCKADVAAADGMADLHTQIDHAQALGLRWLLTFGADDRSQYETYVKMMAEAADYAQERGLKVVIKPHGSGASGAQLRSGSIREILFTTRAGIRWRSCHLCCRM